MSSNLLGASYDSIKQLIYPTPPYTTFAIKKRNGSVRQIYSPRRKLKDLQLRVLAFINDRARKAKPCVHAFTHGRSILTNARQHCSPQTKHLLNIDLEDFFPSITFFRVRGVFQAKPFNCSYEVATVLAQICTFNNQLPQGAPTSPAIANLVCRALDRDLMKLARRNRATYTRYADDMTFSFSVSESSRLPRNLCSFDSGTLHLGDELLAIIANNGFKLNHSKSRLSTKTGRLEVTGLTINEFPNVRRSFIDKIRGALHAWDRYGFEKADKEWQRRIATAPDIAYEKRVWKRQRRTKRKPKFIRVLRGRLLFLLMVRGTDDVLYTRLAERYNALCLRDGFPESELPVLPIVRNSEDVEQAVCVIEWIGDYAVPGSNTLEPVGGQGTAFAYKGYNRLITCDHVLRWSGTVDGQPQEVDCTSDDVKGLSLTVQIPSLNMEWPVRVLHRDRDRDLALLEFTGPSPLRRYFSSTDIPVKRNEAGVLIGFPNWSRGRPANLQPAPLLSRFTRSGLLRFEIGVNIRQGNSGGPFVDALFRVGGIAQQGSRQDEGNDECLCVSVLNEWLDNYDASVKLSNLLPGL